MNKNLLDLLRLCLANLKQSRELVLHDLCEASKSRSRPNRVVSKASLLISPGPASTICRRPFSSLLSHRVLLLSIPSFFTSLNRGAQAHTCLCLKTSSYIEHYSSRVPLLSILKYEREQGAEFMYPKIAVDHPPQLKLDVLSSSCLQICNPFAAVVVVSPNSLSYKYRSVRNRIRIP